MSIGVLMSKKSQELLNEYLNGASMVTLGEIEKQERKELFQYYIKKFSLNRRWLSIAVFPLAFVVFFVSDN